MQLQRGTSWGDLEKQKDPEPEGETPIETASAECGL